MQFALLLISLSHSSLSGALSIVLSFYLASARLPSPSPLLPAPPFSLTPSFPPSPHLSFSFFLSFVLSISHTHAHTHPVKYTRTHTQNAACFPGAGVWYKEDLFCASAGKSHIYTLLSL